MNCMYMFFVFVFVLFSLEVHFSSEPLLKLLIIYFLIADREQKNLTLILRQNTK